MPAVGIVGSAPPQIWPYSSLFLLPTLQFPPKYTVLSWLQRFNPLHLLLWEWVLFILFGPTAPGVLLWLCSSLCFIGHTPASVPHRTKEDGWRGLLGLTYSVGLGRESYMTSTNWDVQGVPAAVETRWMLLQSEAGCALSQRNWPPSPGSPGKANLHRLPGRCGQ